LLGLEAYADDPRFATNQSRVKNLGETAKLVQDALRDNPVQHWLDLFMKEGIPCAPIQTLDAALAHPQVAARGIVTTAQHPTLGEINQIGFPVRFNHEDRANPKSAPLHGQHTAEILKQAGYDQDAIEDFLARDIVRES